LPDLIRRQVQFVFHQKS